MRSFLSELVVSAALLFFLAPVPEAAAAAVKGYARDECAGSDPRDCDVLAPGRRFCTN
jgi:hypothetical protein